MRHRAERLRRLVDDLGSEFRSQHLGGGDDNADVLAGVDPAGDAAGQQLSRMDARHRVGDHHWIACRSASGCERRATNR